MSHHHAHLHKPHRQADLVLQRSSRHFSAMSLIRNTQIKLWKAMLVGLFFAGAISSMTFVVGLRLNIGDSTSASGVSNVGANLFPGSKVDSEVFSPPGEGIEGLINETGYAYRQFGKPSVSIKFPGSKPVTLTQFSIMIDPSMEDSSMLVKTVSVEMSDDCKTFTQILTVTKDQFSPLQTFALPAQTMATCMNVILMENYGNSVWGRLKGLRVFGF